MHQPLNVDISGDGPTVVLIHGVAGGLHIWDPIVPMLAKHFTVVRLNLLGYGDSPKPHVQYTIHAHLEAIHRTLVSSGIKQPFTIIGLSMGASLALEYATRWPGDVRSIVAIGLPYFADEKAARKNLRKNIWIRLTLEHPWFANVFIPVAWWLGRHRIINPQPFSTIYTPTMLREALRNPYRVFKSTLLHCMIHHRVDEALVATSDMRRLFITGDNDQWAKANNFAALLKPYHNSRLTIIPDASHNVVVLKPQETAQAIMTHVHSLQQ